MFVGDEVMWVYFLFVGERRWNNYDCIFLFCNDFGLIIVWIRCSLLLVGSLVCLVVLRLCILNEVVLWMLLGVILGCRDIVCMEWLGLLKLNMFRLDIIW